MCFVLGAVAYARVGGNERPLPLCYPSLFQLRGTPRLISIQPMIDPEGGGNLCNSCNRLSTQAACKGGTVVSAVQEYCNDGYEGVGEWLVERRCCIYLQALPLPENLKIVAEVFVVL